MKDFSPARGVAANYYEAERQRKKANFASCATRPIALARPLNTAIDPHPSEKFPCSGRFVIEERANRPKYGRALPFAAAESFQFAIETYPGGTKVLDACTALPKTSYTTRFS